MENRREIPLELAKKIVQILHEVTANNVNFMGVNGEIIATIQPERLGTIHEGAKRIMQGEVDEIAISQEDAEKMKGVLPGYNGVIKFNGERMGCVGITGDPKIVKPLQKMAGIIIKDILEKDIKNQERQISIEKLACEIQEISASIQEITAGAEEISRKVQEVEGIINETEDNIKDINKVLYFIKNIVKQTNLLGLNALIEAARAGESGRGFAIVAEEIRKLSLNSSESLENINRILKEIITSILKVSKEVKGNNLITKEQTLALQQIAENIMRIQDESQKLI